MNKIKEVPRLYVLSWGPDSRHLHTSEVFKKWQIARHAYDKCDAKAKQLVRIEYPHRMSEGENRKVLKEKIN